MESVVRTAATRPRERAAALMAILPWYLTAMLAGSTSIVVGLLWDISWHMTIGRDTFWTPAHLLIHFGGLLAGFCCGWLALHTTFAGTAEERGATVRLWGFRAPFGAWVAVWGTFAMLTSAPFDNWWHDAYGLDVKILSPPHSLLGGGMIAVQLGAMLIALALQNRAGAAELRPLGLAHLYGAGVVTVMALIFLTEYSEPQLRHGALFYGLMSAVVPFLLVAVARSSRLRWSATIAAGFYMLIAAAMCWILPRFPAHPKLGPINHPMDHMAPPLFPLLLVVPALAIDLFLQRREGKRAGWLDAVLIGASFLALFFVTHWYFADFQLSPASRNAFFVSDQFWSYSSNPGPRRYTYWDADVHPVTAAKLGIALLISISSTRLGLWWGEWMSRVKR
jgi:hypothetical protein